MPDHEHVAQQVARKMRAQVNLELRHGVAVGVSSTGDIVPRPKEGRHVQLSMRCRASGDRWVLMIRDQTGPGRHRPCTICSWATQAAHPGHAPRDAG